MLLKRSRVSLAVALASAALITGCAPEDTVATVEDADNQPSTPTNITDELGIVTGQAIVAQQDIDIEGDTNSPCGTNGGIKVSWGNDDNGDNRIDTVIDSVYVCHGEDGATGAKGDKGDTGAAGQNGLDGNDGVDGNSAFFEKVAATTSNSNCTAGGWKFTFGTKNSSGDVVTSDTAEICNGVDGSDGTTTGGTVTANDLDDKIAQGKALVANAKTYLNKLTSQDMQAAYETYGADLEAAVSGDAVAPMYGVMVVTLGALIDGFVNETDQAAFESQLSDMVADSNLSIVKGNNYVVAIDAEGASVQGLIFQSTDTDSTGMITNYLADMDLVYNKAVDDNGDTTESLAVSSFTVTADQAYTLSFSNVDGAELKTKLGESVIDLIRSETDNAPALASADSAMSLALKGLTLRDFSDNLEFVADANLAASLSQSDYVDSEVAIAFTGLFLKGQLTFDGEATSIGANITLPADSLVGDSGFEVVVSELENALNADYSLTIPYTIEDIYTDETETYWKGYRVTLNVPNIADDFISVLNNYNLSTEPLGYHQEVLVEAMLSDSELQDLYDLVDINTNTNGISNFEYTVSHTYNESEGLESYSWANSTNQSFYGNDLTSLKNHVITNVINNVLDWTYIDVNYDGTDIFASSSWVIENPTIDNVDSTVTAYPSWSGVYQNDNIGTLDIGSIQAWVQSTISDDMYIGFNLSDGNASDVLTGDVQFDIAIGEGLDLTTLENGAVTMVGLGDEGLHLSSSLSLVPSYWEGNECRYYDLMDTWQCGSGYESVVEDDSFQIKIAVTDNEGAELVLQFQDPLVGQEYNALVRVDGIPVGQLVENNQGEPVIQFRDFEIVPLIE